MVFHVWHLNGSGLRTNKKMVVFGWVSSVFLGFDFFSRVARWMAGLKGITWGVFSFFYLRLVSLLSSNTWDTFCFVLFFQTGGSFLFPIAL